MRGRADDVGCSLRRPKPRDPCMSRPWRQVEVLRDVPASARRGSDARTPRRDRDVSRHRDVRPVDPGHVRGRRDDRERRHLRRALAARPARATRRSLAPPDQPRTRSVGRADRPRRAMPDRLAGTRPRGTGTRAARFRFDDSDLTRLQEWTAESGIRWGSTLRIGHRSNSTSSRPGHGDSASTGSWSACDDRGRPASLQRGPAPRRRRERGDRPRRTLRRFMDRSRRPSIPSQKPRRSQRGRSADAAATPGGDDRPRRLATRRTATPARGDRRNGDHRGDGDTAKITLPDCERSFPTGCAGRRPGPTSGRASDDLHARPERRCPIASSVCSASTTGSSHASRSATETT